MISIIGLGFVGLTTALGFSDKGFKVYGFDENKTKLDLLIDKKIPFFEPSLGEVLNKELNKNFFISPSLEQALSQSHVVFICVGTPTDESGNVDLGPIYSVIRSIADRKNLLKKHLLVIKSTVPPSTTKEKIAPYLESLGLSVGTDVLLCNNPEFLREGHAWDDFIHPDRIVIGDESSDTNLLYEIYQGFQSPIYKVSLNTAEFIKYLSNTLLSSLISFSNEMSMIADTVGGIELKKSFDILHQDKRWSGSPASMSTYAYPGCGFGGYCLPKDTQALIGLSSAKGFKPRVLSSVMEINTGIKDFLIRKVSLKATVEQTVGILGLSFKPDSDDVRDSPAARVIGDLIKKGYTKIIGYDPIAVSHFKNAYQYPIDYASTLDEIIGRSDLLVILTAWDEFKKNKEKICSKNVLDFRYCF